VRFEVLPWLLAAALPVLSCSKDDPVASGADGGAAATVAVRDVEILNVSYDPTREL